MAHLWPMCKRGLCRWVRNCIKLRNSREVFAKSSPRKCARITKMQNERYCVKTLNKNTPNWLNSLHTSVVGGVYKVFHKRANQVFLFPLLVDSYTQARTYMCMQHCKYLSYCTYLSLFNRFCKFFYTTTRVVCHQRPVK